MAWVKIPAEHHPLFLAAVPKDPRVTTLKMFGGIAAKVNGQMFAGLFAKSFIVKLSEKDHAEALGLDGAAVFDPMGNGRLMKDTILMPEETFGEDAELRSWLRRALDHTVTLPPKAAKKAKTAKTTPATVVATKPAPKKAPKKAAAKATAKAPNKAAAKKPTKKPTKKRPLVGFGGDLGSIRDGGLARKSQR